MQPDVETYDSLLRLTRAASALMTACDHAQTVLQPIGEMAHEVREAWQDAVRLTGTPFPAFARLSGAGTAVWLAFLALHAEAPAALHELEAVADTLDELEAVAATLDAKGEGHGGV